MPMATAAPFYPPAPANVPPALTTPSRRYRLQVVLVLASLMSFVVLYVGLIAAAAYSVYWAYQLPAREGKSDNIFLKMWMIGGGTVVFLFLVKGLFKSQTSDSSLMVEITEAEQPELF